MLDYNFSHSTLFTIQVLFFMPFSVFIGQWGSIGFEAGLFFGFVAATLASVIESIGDYHACARSADEPPPPAHAVNRGVMTEGFTFLVAAFPICLS